MNYNTLQNKFNYFKSDFLLITMLFIFSRFTFIFIGMLYNINYESNIKIYELLCQWDSNWYTIIVEQGYINQSWAFFPLLPLITKIVVLLFSKFSLTTHLAGIIVSNIAIIITAVYIIKYYKITRKDSNYKEVLLLLFLGPYSFYFSSFYSESLFAMFIIIHFYYCKKKKYLFAGLAAGAASGTRLIGVFLVFVLLYNMVIQEDGDSTLNKVKYTIIRAFKEPERLLAILICPLGTFLYMFYLYFKVGDVWAFKHAQVAWGRKNVFFLKNIYNSLFVDKDFNYFYLAVITVIIIILYIIFISKKYYDEGLYALFTFIIPLNSSVGCTPRYAIGTLFILFIIADLLKEDNKTSNIILNLLCIMEFFLVYLWYTGNIILI